MNATKTTTLTVFTTPTELREIADRMESTWPKLTLGESVVIESKLIRSKNAEIWWLEFAVDQEKIRT